MAVKRAAPAAGAPRPAQRRRTRKAIVEAATALLARGETPSVAAVAAAADVSRRTVYMYFPTFDQLLIDATVGALSQASVDRAIDAGPPATESDDETVEDRVERLVRAMHRVSPEVERLGRTLIRLTVEGSAAGGAQVPRRGYRRVEWIESALAPWRGRIDAARWRRLVCALAMVVGWEALIVQRDVCALNAAEGEALSVWAARALLRATVADAGAARKSGPRGKRLIRRG
jgi:AcrR family transcriptional regulator